MPGSCDPQRKEVITSCIPQPEKAAPQPERDQNTSVPFHALSPSFAALPRFLHHVSL